ncbi:WD repeat-containing protein pop2-like isoform X2 [Limulus polyphemus]|nr:WD repeat-containing protein pop2-like isoform X2 [Limulus polyphemus]
MDLASDGSILATGGKDLSIRLYDTNTTEMKTKYFGALEQSFDQSIRNHAYRIFSLCFHPQQKYILASGGWDESVKVWDLRTEKGLVRNIYGPHICGDALDIEGETNLLTGSWVAENALQLWDLGSGKLISNVPYRSDRTKGEYLYCAKFTEGSLAIAGGSGSCSGQIISLKNMEVLGEVKLSKAVHALDVKHKKVIMGSMEPRLKLLTLQQLPED